MHILDTIIAAVIFFLPAYVANAMPVIASGLKLTPSLAKPINEKVFGKSKTYRGFVYGLLGAIIVGLIQVYFKVYAPYAEFYFELTIILSILLGFGALIGDLFKSFLKRKIGKKSGEPWLIFDQIDYILGAILFSSFIFNYPIGVIITVLIISPLFSLGANVIAYKLKIKKVWW